LVVNGLDIQGDPLPPGALARLGTLRLRDTSQIMALALTPQGDCVFTGSKSGAAIKWEIPSGRKVLELERQTAAILTMAVSPDGSTLVTGGLDNTVRLWDARNGTELRKIEIGAQVISVAFSASAQMVGAASRDGQVRLWFLGEEAEHLAIHEPGVEVLTFLPDGKHFAAAGILENPAVPRPINIRRVSDGQVTLSLASEKSGVTALAFSPDGLMLASGDPDENVSLWDLQKKAVLSTLYAGVKPFPGERHPLLTALAFSPDGRYLATGTREGEGLKVWDLKTRKEVFRLRGRGKYLAYSPDGKWLVSAANKRVFLTNAITGELHPGLNGHQATMETLKYSPDGAALVSQGSDHAISLWDPLTGREVVHISDEVEDYNHFAYLRNNQLVVFGSTVVEVWDLAPPRKRSSNTSQSLRGATLVCTSPDGSLAVFLTLQRDEVRIYHIEPFEEGATLPFKPGYRCVAAVDPADHLLALRDPTEPVVTLFDIRLKRDVVKCPGYGGRTLAVAFSPDGRLLATGDGSNIRCWEVCSGRELITLRGHESDVQSLRFLNDGRTLVSRSLDKTFRTWILDRGTEIFRIQGDAPFTDYGGDQTGDCPLVVIRGEHGLHIYDSRSGVEQAIFKGNQGIVRHAAFSPGARRLATASEDGTGLIWSMREVLPSIPRISPTNNPTDVSSQWVNLASDNVFTAYQAGWALVNAGAFAVEPLKEKLLLSKSLVPERVRDAVSRLDDEDPSVRTRAMSDLREAGEGAEPFLLTAYDLSKSNEQKARLDELLNGLSVIPFVNSEKLRDLRVLGVLEHLGTKEAYDLIRTVSTTGRWRKVRIEAAAITKRLRESN
jgi:WD40 repeat protein